MTYWTNTAKTSKLSKEVEWAGSHIFIQTSKNLAMGFTTQQDHLNFRSRQELAVNVPSLSFMSNNGLVMDHGLLRLVAWICHL